jgi:hypothetical protein
MMPMTGAPRAIAAMLCMTLAAAIAGSESAGHSEPRMRTRGDAPPEFRGLAQHSSCVPPALHRHVQEHIARNRLRLGVNSTNGSSALAGAGAGAPVIYEFFPMAGNTDHGDIVNGQFVDLAPAMGRTHDYACREFVSDGHSGVDCGILTFTHQAIGVPVFAAADGVVVFAQDGWPDMNLFGGVQGNIIAIDHRGNVTSEYYHLKNGSVAVTLGQPVKAGQQIAMCASSGNSFGPHLHFQTLVNGQVYEPFAGPCRPGPSAWTNQAPLDTDDLFLVDFGITKTDLNTMVPPGPAWWQPWEIPCNSQFSIGDPSVFFYWQVYNFPALCPYSVKFFRPDNSLAWDDTSFWGNPEFFRHQKAWFGYDFQAMGPAPGTWRIEFSLDGQLLMNAPFEVVTGPADPNFNRPPQPITLAFDPPTPTTDDVVFCRVSTVGGAAREDLDWDIVRYRYVWQVNGVTVRDVTNAAQSDAIPHHLACGDSTLTCTVTPGDGTEDGPPALASVIVSGPHTPDVNCSGQVDVDDLIAVILAWGACPAPPAPCPADVNSSGAVDVDDLIAVVLNWG